MHINTGVHLSRSGTAARADRAILGTFGPFGRGRDGCRACCDLRGMHRRTPPLLSQKQIHLLERHSCEFRMRHIEANGPGELFNQDTFYWGTLKGVGKVYV